MKSIIFNQIKQKFIPIIALLILGAIIYIFNHEFLNPMNILNLLRQVSVNALIAFGMTLVILSGGIDLSVGAILALSGAIFAGMLKFYNMDPILAIFCCCIFGAFLGFINGLLITKGKIAPFIATLGTMTIYRGLTLVYTNGNPITNLSDSFYFLVFGRGYMLGLPIPAVVIVITLIILWIILHQMPLGRKIYATGDNERATIISGINIDNIKSIVYTISGLLSALSSTIVVSRLDSAQPTAGMTYELDAIAAVVLGGTSLSGGKGIILGTLIGVLIIGTLNNGLNLLNVSSFYQSVIKGMVILLAVLIDAKNINQKK